MIERIISVQQPYFVGFRKLNPAYKLEERPMTKGNSEKNVCDLYTETEERDGYAEFTGRNLRKESLR
jgi:hypothetical protein